MTHDSNNSLDWSGMYKGVTQTPDGNDVITIIELLDDLTYVQQTAAESSNGSFKWNKSGNEIVLEDAATKQKTTFMVGEEYLKKITDNGAKLEDYQQNMMNKIHKEVITQKYWKLIEVNGNPVEMDVFMGREPFIILREEDSRFHGTGGCNTFNGSYELNVATNQISFSQMMSTQMACPNMQIDSELARALEATDNYTMSADGANLSLNRARMAPLARFEVVYLK